MPHLRSMVEGEVLVGGVEGVRCEAGGDGPADHVTRSVGRIVLAQPRRVGGQAISASASSRPATLGSVGSP
jgi:hypothetical protein